VPRVFLTPFVIAGANGARRSVRDLVGSATTSIDLIRRTRGHEGVLRDIHNEFVPLALADPRGVVIID